MGRRSAPLTRAKTQHAAALPRRRAGEPLDGGVRGYMEARFGHDFGAVRIHRDGLANQSAESLGAAAYAVGQHVVFARGRYDPSSPSGRYLLAHELAHAREQPVTLPRGPLPVTAHTDPAEQRANDAALAALRGEPAVRVPRARAALQCTVEEARLSDASVRSLLAASPHAGALARFRTRLNAATSLTSAQASAEAEALALWQAAHTAAGSTHSDDRPLYWVRLQLTDFLRAQYAPSFTISGVEREALVALVERASRGMTDVSFSPERTEKRILISGFDPFQLDLAITRSNPAGAAALALDGLRLNVGSARGRVEAVVFPVRFRDFDQGVVESTFGPYLQPPRSVDMIMTISQNGVPDAYELERWAGRRRTLGVPDNLQLFGDGSGTARSGETVPNGQSGLEEFERTGLPVPAMLAAQSSGVPIREDKSQTAAADGTAISGSGGNYLSNEIFYRVASLERTSRGTGELKRTRIPVGHLHVPLMEPPSATTPAADYNARRQAIVDRVQAILRAALPAL